MTDDSSSERGSLSSELSTIEGLNWQELLSELSTFVAVYAESGEVDHLYERAMDGAEQIEAEGVSVSGDDVMAYLEPIRDMTLFFSFVSQVSEDLMAHLVCSEVIAEESQNDAVAETVEERLGFYDLLDLLHAADVIDDGLKGELKQTRELRNRLVHDTMERMTPNSMDAPTTQVDRGYRSTQKLMELCFEKDIW